MLREIGGMLINIHGQHDNQILLDSEKHLEILDSFGGDNTLLESYRETFRRLQQTARQLGDLKKQEQSRIERARHLNEIIDDIGGLELSEDEDDILEKEYETAKNAERTIIAIRDAIQAITGEDAANELISGAERELVPYIENSRTLKELYERLSAAKSNLRILRQNLKAVRIK